MEIFEILDEDYLLRRIPVDNPNYIKPDGNITSFAFKPKKGLDEISVNLKKLTSYRDSVLDDAKFKLVQLTAVVVRQNNLDCNHSPEPDNYSHSSIKGNFINSASKNMARNSVLLEASMDFNN